MAKKFHSYVEVISLICGKVISLICGVKVEYYHSYVESNFLNDINELIYKTETDLQISKTWLLKIKCGKGEGEIRRVG